MLRLQVPLPDSYTAATEDELVERIAAAKATLGDQLVILGHHYQRDEVIRWADKIGDSFKLARFAADNHRATDIVFLGGLISHLIDSILPLHRQAAFPVAQNHRLHGMLSLEDLKSLPRERWHLTRARDVMRPIAPRFFVEPNATLAYAQELMRRNGIGSVAVVGKTGELVGFLQSGRFKRTKRKK